MLDKSLNILKPYEVDDLIRLGRKEDGGYILSEKVLKNTNILISFGMANDWSFEQDFLNYNKDNKVYIYDHTVNLIYFVKRFYKSVKRLFYFKSSLSNINVKLKELINYLNIDKVKFIHIKKKVDLINSKTHVDIKEIFSQVNKQKVILKIDIEGDEYKILNVVNKNFKHIYLLIIEFHDIHKNMSKIKKFLNKSKLKLIHIHGNNYAGKNKNKDPNVLEFTMLNSKKFKIIKNRSSFKYPVYGLDYKNFTRQSDIDLKFND